MPSKPKMPKRSTQPKRKTAAPKKNSRSKRKGLSTKVVGPTTVRQMVKEMKALRAPRKASEVKLQPYLERAMVPARSGRSAQVYVLSKNRVTPNKKQKKETAPARYNTDAGRGGPSADHFGPIVRKQPIGVTDMKQLSSGSPYNIPNEFGITNDKFPAQEVAPTRGGQWSGRTGPIK